MNDRFQKGDMVNILPYGEVRNHMGICQRGWEKWAAQNPHVVASVNIRGGYCILAEEGSCYCWPMCGLERAEEDLPSLDDLV